MLKMNLMLVAASAMFFASCRTTDPQSSETKGFGTENMTIGGKAIDKYVWALPRVSKSGTKFICFYYNDNDSNFSTAKQFSKYAVKQDDFLTQLKSTAQSVSQKALNKQGADVAYVTDAIPAMGSVNFEMEATDVPVNYGLMTEQFLNDLRNKGRTDKIAKVTYKPFGFTWYLLARIEKADMFDKGFQCADADNAEKKAESTIASFDDQKEIMRSVHDAMHSAKHPTSGKSILNWKNVSKGWAFEGQSWGY